MERRTLFWARTEVFASQLENCTPCLPLFGTGGGLTDAHSAPGHTHSAFLCPYKHPQSHRHAKNGSVNKSRSLMPSSRRCRRPYRRLKMCLKSLGLLWVLWSEDLTPHMHTLRLPAASVRLLMGPPLAGFQDGCDKCNERSGNELGHTFSALPPPYFFFFFFYSHSLAHTHIACPDPKPFTSPMCVIFFLRRDSLVICLFFIYEK